ncbi:MAG TPA: class I SAM-dependent methyltransferase [Blastocatellia bacterium]|nr:class I SAM-dependent methyltransferase [Blastocatellia bacterium]
MSTKRPEDVLTAWAESALYWEKHRAVIRAMFAPITDALLHDAGIRSGESVLDVAGGTGEPSLTIAAGFRAQAPPPGPVETDGGGAHRRRLVCTDAVFAMVSAARQEAVRLSLTDIEFCACLGDALPFPANSFDVVLSRLGTMFFPDTLAALTELLRATKPGGRLALAVWRSSEVNPFFRIVTDVMSHYVESPPEDPQAPGAFRFAEAGVLAGLLRRAGAIQVTERIVPFKIEAPIPLDRFWYVRSELSDTLREKVKKLSAEQLRSVEGEVTEAARQFFKSGKMAFPGEVIVVGARKIAN